MKAIKSLILGLVLVGTFTASSQAMWEERTDRRGRAYFVNDEGRRVSRAAAEAHNAAWAAARQLVVYSGAAVEEVAGVLVGDQGNDALKTTLVKVIKYAGITAAIGFLVTLGFDASTLIGNLGSMAANVGVLTAAGAFAVSKAGWLWKKIRG